MVGLVDISCGFTLEDTVTETTVEQYSMVERFRMRTLSVSAQRLSALVSGVAFLAAVGAGDLLEAR